jgi:Putative restriction endonuclease
MINPVLLLPKHADRQLVYSGIDWQQFKLIQAGFAEAPGIRLAYFNGTIEILMPGRTHEFFKSIIGMLIELFCLEMAIEVVLTSGGLEKLQRYQILGISEVWFWKDGVFSLYHLRDGKYDRITRSKIPELTSLDIDLLTRCVLIAETSRLNAANEFRKTIKSE